MNVLDEIITEVECATEKFPTWPTDPLHALAVLGEKYGELTKAMLQLIYEPHKTTHDEVRMEASQTAAMSLRLAMSLDRYEYRRGEQHNQNLVPKIVDKTVSGLQADNFRLQEETTVLANQVSELEKRLGELDGWGNMLAGESVAGISCEQDLIKDQLADFALKVLRGQVGVVHREA